jgi:hypothetical protein
MSLVSALSATVAMAMPSASCADGADHGCCARIAANPAHEAAIDLQHAHRQLPQTRKRRKSRPEVVECDSACGTRLGFAATLAAAGIARHGNNSLSTAKS